MFVFLFKYENEAAELAPAPGPAAGRAGGDAGFAPAGAASKRGGKLKPRPARPVSAPQPQVSALSSSTAPLSGLHAFAALALRDALILNNSLLPPAINYELRCC